MKKLLNFGLLSSLLLVGCQDDQLVENRPIEQKRSIEISAELGEDFSRTYIDSNNKLFWNKTDELSVFMAGGTEASQFKVAKLSEDGRTAAFKGDVIIWGGADDAEFAHLANVAFYPYSESLKSISHSEKGYSLIATLPAAQKWGGNGTFAPNTFPMIAVTETYSSYSFRFKNVAAVTRLYVKAGEGFDATKIVKANMTVKKVEDGTAYDMAGTYTVTATYDGVPSVVPAAGAVNTISLECEGAELDTENVVSFTFVHFPLELGDKILSFELYDSNGSYMTYEHQSSTDYTSSKVVTIRKSNPLVYTNPTNVAQQLLDALAAAKSGDVVDFTLPIDITLDEQLYVKGGVTLNLDLNGYSITSKVTDKSSVKIDRLSGVLNAKNGTIKNVAGSNSIASPGLIQLDDADGQYMSKLILDGVTLEQNQVGSNNVSYAISYSSSADLELTNVTMNAVNYGIKASGQAAPTGGGLVINSGTYTASNNVLAQGTNGTIFGTINGGYFKSTNNQCIGISTKGTGTEIVFRSGYFSDNKYQYAEWEESGNAEYPYTVANTGYSYNETTKQGEIWSAKGMKAFYAALIGGKKFEGGTLKLTASIDMAGFEWDSHSESGSTQFFGTFDGGNNTITNLTLVASKKGNYATLFSLFSGEVKDLTIDGVTATDNTDGGRASAIAGYTAGGKLSGVTVKNLTAVGFQKVAGLVSNFPEYGELTIENCHVEKATLKLNEQEGPLWQAGGILGYAVSFKKLVVENCSVSNITIEDAATKADCADMPYYCHPFIGNLDNNNAEGKDSEAILNNNKVEFSTVTDVHGECSSDYYAFGKARNTSKLTITIDEEQVYPPLVAFIGTQGYETLQEALAAAENGDIITIVEGEYVLPSQLNSSGNPTKTVTLKGLGENYTTVLSFNSQPGGADGGLNCYADNMSLVFENLKVVSPNTGSSYTGGFGRAKSVTFNNCEFIGQYRAGSAVTTFNECTIDPQTSYIYTDYADATFNKCTFNASEGKAIQVYNDGSNSNTTITITECEFIAAKQATTWDGKPVTAIDINSNGEIFNVMINKTTTTGFAQGLYSGSDLWNIKGGEKYVNLTIDGVKYITSAESLANSLKAEDNEINVILLSDIDLPISSLGQQTGGSGEYKLGGTSTDKINIDLNEKKLNITTTYWSAIGAKNDNATFTIKNGTMTSSSTSGTWNSYDVTFANCNYVIEDVDFLKSIAFTNAGKIANLTNVDITETHDYYALWITAEGQTVKINGGNITSDGRGIKIDEEYVGDATKALVNLEVNDYEFKTAKKAAILVKSAKGADIKLSSVDITNVAADTEYAVWCDEDAAAYYDLITVTGGKLRLEGYKPVTNGVMVNDASTEYLISNKAGLLWLADQVTQGIRFTGKTVKLTADIDFAGDNWTPIGNAAGTNYTHNFEGTFDGNGKTISNLTVNNTKCAGLFGRMCKGAIKNLTINGATLTTNHYAGAIVAWMEQGGGAFTLDNCHVKDVTITVTPDGEEGAYDNGDKAGAIAGYMWHGTITNCTATNVTATAYRDLGGIVGYVKNSTVSGNKVNGAKLTIDQVTNYYGDKAANVGQIIGRRDGTPNESNNTYSNVTIETKTAQDGNFNKPVLGGGF